MAFLAKGRKDDLLVLASEMGLDANSNMKVIELKDLITTGDKYEEEFVKGLLNTIVDNRKEREDLELQKAREEKEERIRKEREDLELQKAREEKEERIRQENFELEKLRLQVQAKQVETGIKSSETLKNPTTDLKNLVHKYNLKEDISLYLVLFERQARRADIPETNWVAHLLGLLPYELTEMIARESEENVKDYQQIKQLLLKRFKLTPEKFRQLFVKLQKVPEKSWLDFYHELNNYFNGWISGLKISTFDQLRDLMITDQIKKRAPHDFKEFFLDEWTNIVSPIQLAEKIEEFEDVKNTTKTKVTNFNSKYKPNYKLEKGPGHFRNNTRKDERVKADEFRPKRTENNNRDFERRKSFKCFECGSSDHLRPMCPKLRKTTESINNISEQKTMNLLAPFTFKGTVNGIQCEILRDSGATIDVVPRRFVRPSSMTGEHVWVQQPLDLTPVCLPVAEILIESELGNFATKAAVIPDVLDRGRYLLGNRSAAILEDVKWPKENLEQINAVQTRRQKLLQEQTDRSKGIIEEIIPKKEEKSNIDDPVVLPSSEVEDSDVSLLKINKQILRNKQRACEDLKPLFNQIEQNHESIKNHYIIKNDLLMKKKVDKTGEERLLVVVPKELRENLKVLCHEGTSSHLGVTKTKDRLSRYFFWPNCFKEVEDFVRTCDKCQKAGKAGEKVKAPLKLVPVISEVFAKINVDAVGPLPVTPTGKKYIITAMCLASKYPDAVAVPDITSTTVVDALLQIFSRMGFPKEIQHDQGTSFMSVLTSEFLESFGIKIIHSSIYHPQSNPVERFHRTMKRIFRVLCQEATSDWEQHVHAILFALRTVTHESTGFTPAELVFGKNLRTPITLLYENWVQPEEENSSVVEYIFNLINRLKRCQDLAVQTMEETAHKRKLWYDRNTVKREFKEGDRVLVLATSPTNKLSVQWQGPGTIGSKISETNYIVNLPGKKNQSQIYHVNLLKPYYSRTEVINLLELEELKDPPDLEIEFPFIESDPNIMNFFEIVQKSELRNRLSPTQIQALQELLCKYSNVFSNEPGLTNLVQHDIELISEEPIRARPYRLSPRQNEILKREINKMLASKIIEVGVSNYTSPMILVEVQGKEPRPCIDYRKLNTVIKTEFFPLPNIEERLEQVSAAKYITVLDLSKGYWQIPLTPRAQELAAFVTNFGSYRPLRMPFGLKNAPYFFSKMMAGLLQGTEKFAVPYLDDIAVFSDEWEDHLKHLNEVLRRISQANLTIKPSKCAFAQEHVKYLGHVIGQGKRSPSEVKVQTIREFPTPSSKTEIRAFLGLAGYYQRYIPQFSIIAAPLTDKLKGTKKREKIEWTPECETAFKKLKEKLSNQPVLYSPDYSKPFLLQTDASDLGVGIVLSQRDKGNREHPVLYLSRKFSTSEKKFSTTEKECAAIVWGIKKLHCYLDGQEFTVQTDHNPLVWLNSNASSNPRLMRWALALQPYHFNIEHKKGILNRNADVLSRIFN